MTSVNIQWFTQDESLWELDWLRYLFSDVQQHIEIESDPTKIKINENTVLICNHAVPYRYVLDELRSKGKRYVIVLLSDENLMDPCEWLHDPQCLGLMRNYVHPRQLTNPKVKIFGLGYKRGFCNYLSGDRTKNLQWSFAGTAHGERKQMLDMFSDLKPNRAHLCSGFNANDGLNTAEYVKLLESSKYALCPPGQDSMDSFRIYEALEAGCVPVTLNNSLQFILRPSYWHAVFYGEQKMPFVSEDWWELTCDAVHEVSSVEYEKYKADCGALWVKWKTLWKTAATNFYKKLER
jgi:hypothetical protein